MLDKEKGQSLLELIIVVALALMVIAALTFATITSLRNAYLSKSSLQATKFAQEGIEKVRSIRDRDGSVSAGFNGGTNKFSQLWGIKLYEVCIPSPCNFLLDPLNNNLSQNNTAAEDLGDSFKRSVKISDDTSSYQDKKEVTVIVNWVDFSGTHESRLTTYLRKI